jgi:hypothetical protein
MKLTDTTPEIAEEAPEPPRGWLIFVRTLVATRGNPAIVCYPSGPFTNLGDAEQVAAAYCGKFGVLAAEIHEAGEEEI